MEENPLSSLKPRILYHIAKAAWEGQLLERSNELQKLLHEEFKNHAEERQVINQIRLAMGLKPHEKVELLTAEDDLACMGLKEESIYITNPAICLNCHKNPKPCLEVCETKALSHNEQGHLVLDSSKCHGEGNCLPVCSFGALSDQSQFLPLIELLQKNESPVIASVAPAFAGQFGPDVTPGKMRQALKQLGFADMVETALYADLITMKEAFEFDEHLSEPSDFFITSCCCPVWIKLIQNKYPELASKISPSVSPMIASGRVIKSLNPNTKVVFIGPCIAKKSEAQLPDLKGAIDFVLTFQELDALFQAAKIDFANLSDDESPLASWAGRVYGRTGGVSSAVEAALNKLRPDYWPKLKSLQADGIPDCQKLLTKLSENKWEDLMNANFFEGMACKGGCVGGPGRLLPPEQGRELINQYAAQSNSDTPIDNPQVLSLLAHLGNQNVNDLTGESPMAQLLSRKL